MSRAPFAPFYSLRIIPRFALKPQGTPKGVLPLLRMIKPIVDDGRRPTYVKKGSLKDNTNILEDNYSVVKRVPKSEGLNLGGA